MARPSAQQLLAHGNLTAERGVGAEALPSSTDKRIGEQPWNGRVQAF